MKYISEEELKTLLENNTVVSAAYYFENELCSDLYGSTDGNEFDYDDFISVTFECDECSDYETEYEIDDVMGRLENRLFSLGIVNEDGSFSFIPAYYDAFEGKYLTIDDAYCIATENYPDTFTDTLEEDTYYFDTSYGNYLPDTSSTKVYVTVDVDIDFIALLKSQQDCMDNCFENDKELQRRVANIFADKDKAVKQSETLCKEKVKNTPLFKKWAEKHEKGIEK